MKIFGKWETVKKKKKKKDNCVIQNNMTTKDYFASVKGDKSAIKSKPVLNPGIESPLILFSVDSLLRVRPFFNVFKCESH